MVLPAFETLPIDCWGYLGKLGVAPRSLCLFHNAPQAGTPLLDALTELKNSSCPARRTLTFRPNSRQRSVRKMRLEMVVARESLQVLSIRSEADSAIIEMTSLGLAVMIDGVKSWLGGAEDFGVSPRHSRIKPKALGTLDRESEELWFWGPSYFGP